MDPNTILAWVTIVSVGLSILLGLITIVQKIRAGKLKEAKELGQKVSDRLMRLVEVLKAASTEDSKEAMKSFGTEMSVDVTGLKERLVDRLKELGLNEPR